MARSAARRRVRSILVLLALALVAPPLVSAADPTLLAAGTAEWRASSLLGIPTETCGGTVAVAAHYVLKELRFELGPNDCSGVNALWFSPCETDQAGNIRCVDTYDIVTLSATGEVHYSYDPPGDYYETMDGFLTRVA